MCETVLGNQIIQHENNNPGENRNKTTGNTSKHFQVVPDRGLLCSFPSSRAVQVVKNLPASAGDTKDMSLILGSRRPPAGGNGKYSSILALEIPWTEEPGGLQLVGLQRAEYFCYCAQ